LTAVERIEWDDSLSVHVRKIDEEHKAFIDAVNNLHDALMEGSLRELRKARDIALDEMENYLQHHFESEEHFMDGIGYPDLPAHRKLHREFAGRIAGHRKDLKKGSLVLSSDLVKEMFEWFRTHIKVEDRKYADFFIKEGGRK
jgi:hemerythrin-like metal-binding protein